MLEADGFVARYLAAARAEAGAGFVGTARDLVQARAFLAGDAPVDAIVVGADEWAFSQDVAARGLPIAFTSPPCVELPAQLRRFPLVRKTYAAFQVIEIVADAIAGSR